MRAYCILLHTFAVLVLCDYGMFSDPSTLPPVSLSSETPNTTDSNVTHTTAEPTAATDDFEGASGLSDTNSTQDTTVDADEDDSNITTTSIPSTRPKITAQTTNASPNEAKAVSDHTTVAVIILVFILILIVLLVGILYYLRNKGRSYSFDLTRVSGPANDYDTPLRSDQQGISYEQTNKDLPVCLDFIKEDKSEEKSSPVANGCAGEKTEQTPADYNEEQNVPEENSFSSSSSSLTPPLKKVEFNLDLDLIGGESDFNDPSAGDATDGAHNENNNNVTNAGRATADEMFTEISLNEPKEHL